jgi:maltooligosyltrehalose trehalohydrolase
MGPLRELRVGATSLGDNVTRVCVWAPRAGRVDLHVVAPHDRIIPLEPREHGYHEARVEGFGPGGRYFFRLDGDKARPDPASRFQPEGVHGPSEVIDPRFDWQDAGWFGLPLEQYVIYELHVGTFTPEGAFDAIIPRLAVLKDLGVTALELMPVAQFPGGRNWGYDGAFPFAVQNSYGGPAGLKRLVNACHAQGLCLILDVVYNHLGPEGNYLGDFGPYFTDRYQTPWGSALNFDGPDSDEVRRFFLENALYWQTEFHVDALRLDAVHAIRDFSARPFLEELVDETTLQARRLNRRFHLIAESDLNDTRLIRPKELGGYGLHAQWSDDFHHALHTLLTGERDSYYQDFGDFGQLVRAYRDGFVYDGRYAPSRQRRHGSSSRAIPPRQLVVCAQNHDQIGNRMLGDRLSQSLSLDDLKLAAAAVILSPYLPLLFMGEEYCETAPFQYFTSHQDPALAEAVRNGRREEFAAFRWQGEVPDPQDEATFQRSKLDFDLRERDRHAVLWKFYRELIRLRKTVPALALLSKEQQEVVGFSREKTLFVRRWTDADAVCLVLHFEPEERALAVPVSEGRWRKVLDSAEATWIGQASKLPPQLTSDGSAVLRLAPKQAVLYQQVNGSGV